jgi:hypothetical protein
MIAKYPQVYPRCPTWRANLSTMQWTSIALLLGLTGCGLLLLKIGGWYFEHRNGTDQSRGAAATLVGLSLLIVALAIIWVVRIRHLLR